MAVHDKELSRFEQVFSYTWLAETWLRYLLTEVWFLYWLFAAQFLFNNLAVGYLLWGSLRGWEGTSPEESYLYYQLALSRLQYQIPALAFLVAATKAIVSYSSRWSLVALVIACYFLVNSARLMGFAADIRHDLPVGALHIAVDTLLHMMLEVCVIICLWKIWRMAPTDAGLFCSSRSVRLFPRRALRPLTAIPASIDFVRKHRLWTMTLIVGGSGFLGVALHIFQNAQSWVYNQFEQDALHCRKQPDSLACMQQRAIGRFLLSLVGTPLEILGCLLVGRRMLTAGMRRVTWSLEDLERPGLGRPVLFLRAFRQDDRRLMRAPSWFAAKLIALTLPRRTLDEIVSSETSAHGPVVALGNPVSKAPLHGPASGYVAAEADWRDTVRDLVDRAQMIIILLDETEGVRWELQHLARSRYRDRCLFLVPPEYSGPAENRELLSKVLGALEPGPMAQAGSLYPPAAPCPRTPSSASSTARRGCVSAVVPGSPRLRTS